MRKGFLFDLNKCVGCEACVVACQIENRGVQSESWRSVSTFNEFRHPALPLFHFSLGCNHCDDPTCMKGCPANAFSIDPILHTLDHNPDRCIGCRYCTWTCPYDAPRYVKAKGIIEKCTLCKERLIDGRLPNCAHLCPTGALDYGILDTDVGNDIAGFTETGIRPAIRIIPLRKRARPLTADAHLTENEHELFRLSQPGIEHKSSLNSEWPLIVFTLLAAFLFAVSASALLGAPMLDPLTFIAVGLGGMVISSIHLGKPARAWRAMTNVRSSWLSREIVFFSLFVGSSGADLLLSLPEPIRILSVLLGLGALVSIDMVYAVVDRKSMPFTNGGSIALTGLLFFALFAKLPVLFVVLLAGNCAIYVRALVNKGRGSLVRVVASAVRIGVGYFIPALLIGMQGGSLFPALCVIIGESIHRAEFYVDLDIMTPRRQITRDLLKELAMPSTGQS